jgi:hypothetical protein
MDYGPGASMARSRWFPTLQVSFLLLQLLDLGTTYFVLHLGIAEESNPIMRILLQYPVYAVFVKVSTAFLALKTIERMQVAGRPGFGLLVALCVGMIVVCLNNLLVVRTM